MTRIKTVYPSDMVAHLWANRHPHNIRNATDNIFTRGNALYSYGAHHVIAAFMDNPAKGGECLILWNENRYGQTTGRHHDMARHALSHDQRARLCIVPDMREQDISPRAFPELAQACIKAAISPLEKSAKARSNRDWHLSTAEKWLDSARKIYAYIGDKKAGASVPTLRGSDMSKNAVNAVLTAINRAEYLAKAGEYFTRAKSALGTVEYLATRYTQKDYPMSARDVCDAGVHCVRLCESAAHEYKKAGANVPPLVTQIKAKARDIVTAHTAPARAESIEEARIELAQSERVLTGALAMLKRGESYRTLSNGKRVPVYSPRSFQWKTERAKYPSPGEYAELWPNEKTRRERVEFWENLRARVNRVECAIALKSSIDSTLETIEKYKKDVEAGARSYSVPDGRFIRANLRKMAIFSGDTAPEFWTEYANRVANEADTIGQAHEAREAAREAAKIEQWRNGESVTVSRNLPPMVRIVGDTVETSYGASVPLDHAARLIRIARIVAAKGGADYPNGTGPKVGFFQVHSIAPDMSAIIGCHSFTASEAAHAAKLIETATATTAA